MAVQLLEAVMREYPVLTHYRNKVRCNADHKEVHQRYQSLKRNTISLRICLDKLESHTATGEVVKRIMTIFPLWIKNRYSLRKIVLREMMVADDDIYTPFTSILDLFVCLDAAVEGNYKSETIFSRPVDSFI